MKQKTMKQILADFKRSNKKARERQSRRAGFFTVDSYLEHLKKAVELEESNGKIKPQIHNVFILDVSSSMSFNMAGLNEGVSHEIEELKKDTNSIITNSIIKFSSGVETLSWKESIEKVNYQPLFCGGMTSLNKAIILTLERVKEEHVKGELTLVKIFTDGQENNSGNAYPYSKIKELIEELKEYDVTVTFVGTQNEVDYAISYYNISEGNTLVHDNSLEQIRESSSLRAIATSNYSKSVSEGEFTTTSTFFKQ